MNKIMLMIWGMALVTYIPRMVPAVFIERMKWTKRAERFLQLIPYTAMGALVFPGILTVDKMDPRIGIVGGITAIVLGFWKVNMTLILIASVSVVMLMYYFLMLFS